MSPKQLRQGPEFKKTTLDLTPDDYYWDNIGEEVTIHIRELIAELGIGEEDLIVTGFPGDRKPLFRGHTWGTPLKNVTELGETDSENPLRYALHNTLAVVDDFEAGLGNLAIYDRKKMKERLYPNSHIERLEFKILDPTALLAQVRIILDA